MITILNKPQKGYEHKNNKNQSLYSKLCRK